MLSQFSGQTVKQGLNLFPKVNKGTIHGLFDFLKKIYLTDDSLIKQTSEVWGDKISINYLSIHLTLVQNAKIIFLFFFFLFFVF